MRFIRGAFTALVLCGLTGLSVCWVVLLFECGFSPDSNFTRYGWGFPFGMFVWAARSSGKLTRARHIKKMAAANAVSHSLGHGRLGETEDYPALIGQTGGVRLGYDKHWNLLRFTPQDGHGMIFGPTGCGKGRDFLLGMILDLDKMSLVIIDHKGTFCATTSRHRATLGKVNVLHPFEKSKHIFPMELPNSSTYNVMAPLDPKDPGFVLACERIADTASGDNKTDGHENAAHFRERARNVIAGVIMHVVETYPPEMRHLGTVRDVITSANGQDFFTFVQDVKENGSRFAKQKLAKYANDIAKTSKEVDDVLSTAARYTEFVGNDVIEAILKGDGFRFSQAKTEITTTYVILPLEHVTTCGKWFSLIIASALHELWRNGRGDVPVVLILDELAQYGSGMDILHAAMNSARNFGIVIIGVVQQLSDLEAMFGKRSGAFVNGAAWKIFCASDDLKTREYVEKLSGTKTVKVPSSSFTEAVGGGVSTNMGIGERGMPVKAGYEIGEIPPDEFLLKVQGLPMIECKRKPYWECDDLKGKFDPDPYEK